MPEMQKNWIILGIALIISVVLVAGCVIINTQAPAGTTVPTPIVTIAPMITTTSPVITTPTPDCQCDLSGGCKEVSSKIEKLIGIRQDCAAEMVKRSIEARRGGETNLNYYMSDNPACDAYSSCTNHCIFELQQHYNEVCLSGYQI